MINSTVVGLNSNTFGIDVAGTYTCNVSISAPTLEYGSSANTAVVTTISQTPHGGSPTTRLTSNAGDKGCSVVLNCAANDTITVAFTSSATVDKGLKAVKATISIG